MKSRRTPRVFRTENVYWADFPRIAAAPRYLRARPISRRRPPKRPSMFKRILPLGALVASFSLAVSAAIPDDLATPNPEDQTTFCEAEGKTATNAPRSTL